MKAKKSVIPIEMQFTNHAEYQAWYAKGFPKTAKNKFGVNPYDDEEIGYWRVSTGRDQDPAYQIDMLRRHGVPEANIFGDIGSGANTKRKKFEFVLKMLAGRPGWTLVVWKIDRLGRDAAELYQLMNRFQKEEWNLVSLTEGIDTSTPMGRAFFGMLAVFAQFERDTIKERTRAGMKHLKESGVELGRVTNITPAQFKDMERRLLAKDGETIKQIADSHKVSTSTVNHHFPKWRSLSADQRRRHRAAHPLPTQRSGPVHVARRRHPRRKRKTT